MKEDIETRITMFLSANPKIKNMVVLGSSCAILQDLFIKGKLKDVDVFIPDSDKSKLIKTEGIDIITALITEEGYTKRLIPYKGKYLLSKKDLIVNIILSLHKSQKLSNKPYLHLLLQNMDLNEIKGMTFATIENSKKTFPEFYENYVKSFRIFKNIYTQEYINNKIGSQDLFFQYTKKELEEKRNQGIQLFDIG